MNILNRSLLLILALTSGMSLSHDIAGQLAHAQKTKKQIQIEEQIAEKKSDLKRDALILAAGLGLFYIGIQNRQEVASEARVFTHLFGVILSGTGVVLGIPTITKLQRLKNKLAQA